MEKQIQIFAALFLNLYKQVFPKRPLFKMIVALLLESGLFMWIWE